MTDDLNPGTEPATDTADRADERIVVAQAAPGAPQGQAAAAAAQAVVLQAPAAGQHLVIATQAGRAYRLTFDPATAQAALKNGDLVLTFPNGGDITLQNFAQTSPQLIFPDGTIVAGNIVVAQIGGAAEAMNLETAAGPGAAPGGGNNVYSDDLGGVIGGLDPQDVIPPTALEFPVPAPTEEVLGLLPEEEAAPLGRQCCDFVPPELGVERAGTAGNDLLDGSIDGDRFIGSGNQPVIVTPEGGEGESVYSGFDLLMGRGGSDTADYSDPAFLGIDANLELMHLPYFGFIGTVDKIFAIEGGEGQGFDVLLSVENVVGTDFDDEIDGSEGANVIDGGEGDDSLYGAGGDDILDGGEGFDQLYGGDGNDTADYSDAPSGIVVSLFDGTADQDGWGTEDLLHSIENVIGSAYGDGVEGDWRDNYLHGRGGNDTVDGGEGWDTVNGGAGDDFLEGGFGYSGMYPYIYIDEDTVDYSDAPGAVVVSLLGEYASGAAGNDTIYGFENAIGSAFNDTIEGDDRGNELMGDFEVVDGGYMAVGGYLLPSASDLFGDAFAAFNAATTEAEIDAAYAAFFIAGAEVLEDGADFLYYGDHDSFDGGDDLLVGGNPVIVENDFYSYASGVEGGDLIFGDGAYFLADEHISAFRRATFEGGEGLPENLAFFYDPDTGYVDGDILMYAGCDTLVGGNDTLVGDQQPAGEGEIALLIGGHKFPNEEDSDTNPEGFPGFTVKVNGVFVDSIVVDGVAVAADAEHRFFVTWAADGSAPDFGNPEFKSVIVDGSALAGDGTDTVEVAFTQDSYDPDPETGGDRNLYVEAVIIGGAVFESVTGDKGLYVADSLVFEINPESQLGDGDFLVGDVGEFNGAEFVDGSVIAEIEEVPVFTDVVFAAKIGKGDGVDGDVHFLDGNDQLDGGDDVLIGGDDGFYGRGLYYSYSSYWYYGYDYSYTDVYGLRYADDEVLLGDVETFRGNELIRTHSGSILFECGNDTFLGGDDTLISGDDLYIAGERHSYTYSYESEDYYYSDTASFYRAEYLAGDGGEGELNEAFIARQGAITVLGGDDVILGGDDLIESGDDVIIGALHEAYIEEVFVNGTTQMVGDMGFVGADEFVSGAGGNILFSGGNDSFTGGDDTLNVGFDEIYAREPDLLAPEPEVNGEPLPDMFVNGLARATGDVDTFDGAEVFRFTRGEPDIGTVVSMDLYLLQDLSGSFGDDVGNVQSALADLITRIGSDLPTDTRLGAGAFVDKPFSPFGSEGDYVFQNFQGLTTDYDAVQTAVNNFIVLSGNDFPESQIEALFQVAKNAGTIGFRDGAVKVVILTTDADYHEAGDYGGGVPNDGDAVIDPNEDYPSVDQLKAALLAAGILPVFAVTEGSNSYYDTLVAALGFGAVVELTSNSSNLIEAIFQGIEDILASIKQEVVIDGANDSLVGGDDVLDGGATLIDGGNIAIGGRDMILVQSEGGEGGFYSGGLHTLIGDAGSIAFDEQFGGYADEVYSELEPSQNVELTVTGANDSFVGGDDLLFGGKVVAYSDAYRPAPLPPVAANDYACSAGLVVNGGHVLLGDADWLNAGENFDGFDYSTLDVSGANDSIVGGNDTIDGGEAAFIAFAPIEVTAEVYPYPAGVDIRGLHYISGDIAYGDLGERVDDIYASTLTFSGGNDAFTGGSDLIYGGYAYASSFSVSLGGGGVSTMVEGSEWYYGSLSQIFGDADSIDAGEDFQDIYYSTVDIAGGNDTVTGGNDTIDGGTVAAYGFFVGAGHLNDIAGDVGWLGIDTSLRVYDDSEATLSGGNDVFQGGDDDILAGNIDLYGAFIAVTGGHRVAGDAASVEAGDHASVYYSSLAFSGGNDLIQGGNDTVDGGFIDIFTEGGEGGVPIEMLVMANVVVDGAEGWFVGDVGYGGLDDGVFAQDSTVDFSGGNDTLLGGDDLIYGTDIYAYSYDIYEDAEVNGPGNRLFGDAIAVYMADYGSIYDSDLTMSGGNDLFVGGNDTLFAGDVHDVFFGPKTDPVVVPSLGCDWTSGKADDGAYLVGDAEYVDMGESLYLDTGSIDFSGGNDTVEGGDDLMYGSSRDDILIGDVGEIYSDEHVDYGGDVTLTGGNDRFVGGNDTLFGGEGADTLIGDVGFVRADGDTGVDTYIGGNDVLDGGEGDDWLVGDVVCVEGGEGNFSDDSRGGNDTLTGGEGNDYFVFSMFYNTGDDVITDFEGSEGAGDDRLVFEDVLDIGAPGLDINDVVVADGFSKVGNVVTLELVNDGTITITDVDNILNNLNDVQNFSIINS